MRFFVIVILYSPGTRTTAFAAKRNFKLYTEVKYLKLHTKMSMTRLTPKLHSLMTLVSPKSYKCNISMNNSPIAVSIEECIYRMHMAHMVKSGQLRANMPK